MLKEINCKYFSEQPIQFDKGLNIILGDKQSTNSIGKSTLLMIIDFVFGGETYLSKNGGAIKELGNHVFNFKLIFQEELFYFSRGTENADYVLKCDSNFKVSEKLEINQYTDFLKQKYTNDLPDISFRSIVSLYSRIWGKENDDVDKPLQSFSKESEATSISNLIKLFNKYQPIAETYLKIKEYSDSKKVIDAAVKRNYIPKTTKTDFKQNVIKIEEIDSQIKDIKENLLQFTLNINELTNKEILELKTEKNKLLDAKNVVQNKIQRIEINLKRNSSIKSKHLGILSTFFEKPNIKKIEEIESFHSKISSILLEELKQSKLKLEQEDEVFNSEIKKLDGKIAQLLQGVESPKYIVERVYDLTIDANKLKTANKFHTEKETLVNDLKTYKDSLETIIAKILSEMEVAINENLLSINKEIHGDTRRAPEIKIQEKKYEYDHFNNTGTGKSYVDLIIFDMTIAQLTQLPFIIHDSPLFKNIEDFTVEKIIEKYTSFTKQVFISIDGTEKYNTATNKIIKDHLAVELSNTKLLFKKDWRKSLD
jgi:hypothetical protein